MNNLGDVHVDWIVSMGIFIIAVLAIFAFLKPTDVKEVDKSLLLDNLIEKFNKNFTWEVRTSPLYVKNCHQGNGVNFTIKVSLKNWEISRARFQNVSGYFYDDNNFDNEIYCNTTSGENEYIPDAFHITPSEEAVFYLIYINESLHPQRARINVSCEADSSSGVFIGNCEFGLGDAESFRGINENWLGPIQVNPVTDVFYDISKIKSNWNFPNSSDFWVNSTDLNLNYRTAIPPFQADVVVREVKLFKIDNKGKKDTVSILFSVW